MKNDGQTTENNRDSGLLSNPLSFLRSGYFYWYFAGLDNRGSLGGYWSLRSASTTNSNYLGFYNALLNPQYYNSRGYGFAVRCNKSFTTLINTSYSMKNNSQTSESNRDSGLLSDPLSFLRSGGFVWHSTSLNLRGSNGFYWLRHSGSTTLSYYLDISNTFLDPQYNNNRGNGFAVRCVVSRVPNPSPISLILAIL